MQGSRLSLAQVSHPSQVVRVWVDPISQSLALLLSDLSCLLYTFKFPSAMATIPLSVSVPGPVTDACFLRLMGSSARAAKTQKQQQQGKLVSSDLMKKEEVLGDGSTVIFLATMPDRGGSGTVLRGWAKRNQGEDSNFARAGLEVKDLKIGGSDGKVRRSSFVGVVLDLPHSFAVKMAATVNVLVLYSAALGKIWVMAGKVKESDENGKLEGNSAKLEGVSASGVVVSLIKCCVVDCSGPIYSIRLSFQHMLLGEEDGVRVWLLRPLVKGKPRKSGREKVVALMDKTKNGFFTNGCRKVRGLDQVNAQSNSMEIGSKTRVYEQDSLQVNGRDEFGLSKAGIKQYEGRELVFGKSRKASVEIEGNDLILKNGGIYRKFSWDLHKNDLIDKSDNGEVPGLTLKKTLRNGLIRNGIEGFKAGSGITSNGAKSDTACGISLDQGKEYADTVSLLNGVQCNCKENKVVQKGPEQGMEVISNGTIETMGNLVNSTLHECELMSLASNRRNGQLCLNRASLDDFYSQQLSQLSSMSLSSSSASSSLSGSLAPSVTMSAPASSSCNIPSVVGSTHSSEGAKSALVSSSLPKNKPPLRMRETCGKMCSFFVPFVDGSSEDAKESRQLGKSLRATDIRTLSQTKFVVLDSVGDLHILSLHNPASTVEGQKEQDHVIAGHSMMHLKCSMKVNMLAVFPEMSSTSSQKLWVSDGRHTIHLLSFPDTNDKDHVDEKQLQLSVMQAVFLSDRVRALAAMAANATFILTQGSIIAYSIAGS